MKRLESQKLNKKYFSKYPIPSVCMLELTHKCNEFCVHCVRDCNGLAPSEDFMTTEDWKTVIDDAASLKTFAISMTGGEPTLHEGFLELVSHAKSYGMAISVKTNALKLEAMAEEMKERGVRYLEISIHGDNAATHDRVTRVPGSFERAIRGIKAARRAGIAATIKCNFFRWNAGEVAGVRALAAELECQVNRDFFLINSDHGRAFDDDFVTPFQVRDIEADWPQASLASNQNKDTTPLMCTQGINNCAITADGEILSCLLVRKPLGHLREMTLVEAWGRYAGRSHSIDYKRFSRCNNCSLLPKCHVCIGQNYSATNDFYEPPLERCYVTMALYGAELYTHANKE